jgi:hypothetical protein
MLPKRQEKFEAAISAADEDELHPRKVVLRARRHRGGYVLTTENMPVIGHAARTIENWLLIANIQLDTFVFSCGKCKGDSSPASLRSFNEAAASMLRMT